jgi:hypothetical protein
MTKYEVLLNDLKEILESTQSINYVSHGRHVNLAQENNFNAVYIVPAVDTFEPFSNGSSIGAYDNYYTIQLITNIDSTSDDLYWVSVRTDIINAVLNDSAIWTNIVDRDIISVINDDFDSYPFKTIKLVFEFRLREPCPI